MREESVNSTGTGGVSRRSVAKGAAWAVPAVAVASAAPAAAISAVVPPPPVITFGGACGNTGATQKGCGGDKTLQVPLTLTNQTGADVVFQITSMYTCNCAVAPTGPGGGVFSGVRGIFATPDHSVKNHNNCGATTVSDCTGGTTSGTIVVPDGTVAKNYWIESVSTGDSSTFSTTINWRMLSASDCTVLSVGAARTASAIAPANCGSDKGTTTSTTTSSPAPAAQAKASSSATTSAPTSTGAPSSTAAPTTTATAPSTSAPTSPAADLGNAPSSTAAPASTAN